MVGFVGVQARRRRRNRFLLVFLILIVFLLFFYIPTINFSIEGPDLPNEILPNTAIDETSLSSEIEELKLKVFQKDQRIKFRDNQILNLKEELNKLNQSFESLKFNYENALGNINEIQNSSSENSTENLKKIDLLNNEIYELNLILTNYKKQISQLENELENSTPVNDLQEINVENSILKNELNKLKQKNIEILEMYNELNSNIETKDAIIKELNYLKDQQHHG